MPRLSLGHTLIALIFLLAATVVILPQVFDPDMYWHVHSGQVMLDRGEVLHGDIFSHTRTGVLRPHHEWLTEVIMAVLYRAFSDYGITLLATFFSMWALVNMFRFSRGNIAVRLVLVLLVCNIIMTTAMGRPQGWMLNFILILMTIVLNRQHNRLPWIPVIMLLWVNLHGGWITGYLVLGAAIVGEGVSIALKREGDTIWMKRLTLWSLAGLPMLLINPYGFEQVLVPLDTFTQAARPYISEWRPPNLLSFNRIAYVAMLTLTVLVTLKAYRRFTFTEWLLLGGFGLWSLMTARIVLIYTFVAPVILTPYLSEWLTALYPRLRTFEATLARPVRWGVPAIGLMSLLVVFLFFNGSRPERIQQIQDTSYPVGAVAFIKQTLPPREVFNTDVWGGYLIANLPEYPVFIDTRADLYDEFFLEFLSIIRAEDGWDEKLTANHVQTVLIDHKRLLTDALRAAPNWALVYEDDLALIFVRQ